MTQVELCFERPGPEHAHGDWQVLFLLDATAELIAKDVQQPLEAGSVCVLPPGISHRIKTAADRPQLSFVDLRLKPEPAVPMTEYLVALTDHQITTWSGNATRMARVACELREILTRTTTPQIPQVMALLWQLLIQPDAGEADLSAPDAKPVSDPRVMHIQSTMREFLEHDLKLDELADRVQLSSSQLSRLFKQHLGVSPGTYLQNLRLELAQQYLVSSTMSIKQIAAKCGFGDANHFSRLFRRHVGCTASAYRQRVNRKR